MFSGYEVACVACSKPASILLTASHTESNILQMSCFKHRQPQSMSNAEDYAVALDLQLGLVDRDSNFNFGKLGAEGDAIKALNEFQDNLHDGLVIATGNACAIDTNLEIVIELGQIKQQIRDDSKIKRQSSIGGFKRKLYEIKSTRQPSSLKSRSKPEGPAQKCSTTKPVLTPLPSKRVISRSSNLDTVASDDLVYVGKTVAAKPFSAPLPSTRVFSGSSNLNPVASDDLVYVGKTVAAKPFSAPLPSTRVVSRSSNLNTVASDDLVYVGKTVAAKQVFAPLPSTRVISRSSNLNTVAPDDLVYVGKTLAAKQVFAPLPSTRVVSRSSNLNTVAPDDLVYVGMTVAAKPFFAPLPSTRVVSRSSNLNTVAPDDLVYVGMTVAAKPFSAPLPSTRVVSRSSNLNPVAPDDLIDVGKTVAAKPFSAPLPSTRVVSRSSNLNTVAPDDLIYVGKTVAAKPFSAPVSSTRVFSRSPIVDAVAHNYFVDVGKTLAAKQVFAPLPSSRVPCVSCDSKCQKTAKAECNHYYCNSCFKEICLGSLHDRSLVPARCCKLPFAELWIKKVLDRDQYLKYCSFKPVPNEVTLRNDDKAVAMMALQFGWKQCPKCGILIERKSGCAHMTCICSFHFCYLCPKPWTSYGHKCGLYP